MNEDIVRALDLILVLQVLQYLCACIVGGCIIDDNNAIVNVILHDDGSNVADVAIIVSVVVGGDHNAEGQLLVLTDLVLLLVVGLLLVG